METYCIIKDLEWENIRRFIEYIWLNNVSSYEIEYTLNYNNEKVWYIRFLREKEWEDQIEIMRFEACKVVIL